MNIWRGVRRSDRTLRTAPEEGRAALGLPRPGMGDEFAGEDRDRYAGNAGDGNGGDSRGHAGGRHAAHRLDFSAAAPFWSVEFHGVRAGQSAFLALERAIFFFGARMGHDRFDPCRLAALRTGCPRRRHRWPRPHQTDHTDSFPFTAHAVFTARARFGAGSIFGILDAVAAQVNFRQHAAGPRSPPQIEGASNSPVNTSASPNPWRASSYREPWVAKATAASVGQP
jgi:hypothetical protein